MPADLILCAAAAVAWVWLVQVAGVLPVVVYVQQTVGCYTPRLVHRLAFRRGRLVVVGLLGGAAAVAFPEARTAVATGYLALAFWLLWYAQVRAAKLLHPRLLEALLPRGTAGPDPGAPVPAA
ncbi:hypothetical protein J0H58_38560 [bacterium]|nr:hypothetical protein [bacterium]